MRLFGWIAAKALIMLESCDAGKMEMLKTLDDGMRGEGLNNDKSKGLPLYISSILRNRA
jgi:hypothetical protein